MSAFANLILLKKEKFEQLEKIGREFPGPLAAVVSTNGTVTVSPEAIEHLKSAAGSFWKFLQENGQSPYLYQSSGYIMAMVLERLKERGIDLQVLQMEINDEDFVWHILDSHTKQEYFERMEPSTFTDEELADWCDESESFASVEEVRAAIKIIHQYLELVDDSNLLLLNIG